MRTLVLSTPRNQVGDDGYRSFDNTLRENTGQEYALFWERRIRGQLIRGMDVIVIDKPAKRCARGRLLEWIPKYTHNGVEHYDVKIEELTEVEFPGDKIPLNRRGVGLI